eukprot:SM000001S04541  [mRNA]  locus=s1:864280:866961:+ [translate_table: standard]
MPKRKFYAVRAGRQPGIYDSWEACERQVRGFSGTQFKSFASRADAEAFVDDGGGDSGSAVAAAQSPPSSPEPHQEPAANVWLPGVYLRAEPAAGAAPLRAVAKASSAAPAEGFYQLEFDGASKGNPGPAGCGALLRRPDGTLECELREGVGKATCNYAEYRALLLGLRSASERGVKRLQIRGDSKLVCMQTQGKWQVNKADLGILCNEAKGLMKNFDECSIRHIDREFNSHADRLANEAVNLAVPLVPDLAYDVFPACIAHGPLALPLAETPFVATAKGPRTLDAAFGGEDGQRRQVKKPRVMALAYRSDQFRRAALQQPTIGCTQSGRGRPSSRPWLHQPLPQLPRQQARQLQARPACHPTFHPRQTQLEMRRSGDTLGFAVVGVLCSGMRPSCSVARLFKSALRVSTLSATLAVGRTRTLLRTLFGGGLC